MGLETGTTVNDLVSTNPVATDPRSEGDDHLRLLKVALKTCFPSLAGAVDRVQAKSAGYTVAVTDTQSLIHCTAALTLGSPAAATAGNGFGFAIFADGFDVVFDPNSTELVNGAATATVGAGSYAYVRCTGAAWLLETPAVSIHAATVKATPIGADEIGYLDSVTSFRLVKMTFTNFWASLATRYMALVAPGTSGNVLTSNGSAWTSAAAASAQIQPISASVAANALTITLSPTTLDFRSSTLTSGAVTTEDISSAYLSVTVPNTATLGTVNGVAARLVVVALWNTGGTAETIGVINLAGGVNLDETTLLASTAISAASDSASVCYSANGTAAGPFRIVGFVDITEATAGTWATAPTLVQGAGGQALAAMSSLGYGQTWQSVTRTSGTTYYNTMGKPIELALQGTNSTGSQYFVVTVNGLALPACSISPTANASSVGTKAIIPAGASYSWAANTGTITITAAAELR